MKNNYTALDVILDCYEAMTEEYSHVRWFHLNWDERNSDKLTEEEKDALEKVRAKEAENLVSAFKNKDALYKDTNAFGQQIVYKRCPLCNKQEAIALQREDGSFEF